MNRLMRAIVIVAMLAGCGGGGGEPPAPTVAGVAAAGQPLRGTVTLKDSSDVSKQLSTSTTADGSFSFNVSGLTAPFLLQGAGTASGNNYTLYSLAANAGNCNINPLTNLAVTMANGGQDPVSIFVTPTSGQIAAISAALPVAMASIQDKLAPIFSRVGASSTSGNVMTDRIAANSQGVDLLFDMVSITTSNGSVSIVNKADGVPILPSTSIANGVLSANPNVGAMSPVFTVTGHAARGVISAKSQAPPSPATPLITVPVDAQGDYKFFVPNGTYEVCYSGSAFFNCLDVVVGNANVTAADFLPPEPVPFETVEHSLLPLSQMTGGFLHVLRSTTEWANFWSMLNASILQQPPLPSINFNEKNVVAFVRPSASGGHSIAITDIQKLATGGVIVYAVHQSPGANCSVLASAEQPYHIVTTPVFSGEATLKLTETVGPACH